MPSVAHRANDNLWKRAQTVEDPLTPDNKRRVALDRAFRTLHSAAPDEYHLLLCRVPLELIGLQDLSDLCLDLAKLNARRLPVRGTNLWQLAVQLLDAAICEPEVQL